MKSYHKLLKRQIEKHLKYDFEWNEQVLSLLSAVNDSYTYYERSQLLLERSINLSSDELFESNKRLREEAEHKGLVLSKLKESVSVLRVDKSFEETISDHDLLELADRINDLVEQRKQDETRTNSLVQDLRLANEELKSFAHIVSHDLKAPLRAIGSLVEWLYEDYHDILDAQGKETIVLLKGRAQRMYDLIEGILQFAKVGRAKQKPEIINLTEFVDNDVLGILEIPNNVEVIVSRNLPVISGEKVLLLQVYQNLVSNSLKFAGTAGLKIEIGCIEDGDNWKLFVKYNGIGIAKRHHQKVFNVFETLKPRDKVEGTGIGLAIVKKIIELNCRQVWIESEANCGATVFFTWPKLESVECKDKVERQELDYVA